MIARIEAPGELGFALRLGYRRVDQSTSGRVLAGFASPACRQRLISQLGQAHGDFDRSAFAARIARVAAQGHERGPSRNVQGVTDIGAPIIGATGWAVGALTVPFILRDGNPASLDDATAIVKREAAAISAELAIGMPGASSG